METKITKIKYFDGDEPDQITLLSRYDLPAEIRAAILDTGRGSYQDDLLANWETWSGSSIKGKARQYAARYAQTRQDLLGRIWDAISPHGYQSGTALILLGDPRRWTRRLVITAPDGTTYLW